jgi:hypothetical protein
VELAPWQVTQVPAKSRLFARLAGSGTIKPLPPAQRATTRPAAAGIARVIRIDAPAAGGIGLDADVLAWTADEMLFVARAAVPAPDLRRIRPGERALVFTRAVPGDTKSPPCNELTFTGPRNDLARGQSPELTVTWELFKQELSAWRDEDVARVMMAQ